MHRADWLNRIASIKQWSEGGDRAPHKPLLLLYAIGRLVNTGSSEIRFAEAERPLKDLLARYGSPRTKPTPQYPFRRLENDRLWQVTLVGDDPDPWDRRVTELRRRATGRFPTAFEDALSDPGFRLAAVHAILDRHFPPSLHDDLLSDVGLEPGTIATASWPPSLAEGTKRDPRFRDLVLTAYEQACAFCGFDGRVDGATVGVEAAHVRWHAMGGPDQIDNGIALCTLHHKLFDKGAVGLDEGHRVLVSQRFVSSGQAGTAMVTSLIGRTLRGPQPGQPRPATRHVQWHFRQVFQGPARRAE